MEKKGQRTPLNTTIRLIDGRLYHYHAIQKAIHDARLDSGKGNSKTVIPHHAFISDTTANTAIANVSELKYVTLDDGTLVTYPERWIKVIKSMYDSVGDRERKALQMRYDEGQKHYYITCELNMSANMLYCVINDARNYILAGACQLGMIRIIE